MNTSGWESTNRLKKREDDDEEEEEEDVVLCGYACGRGGMEIRATP